MTAPFYTPIADDLPAVFHEDAASSAQLHSFLALLDDPNRVVVDLLDHLDEWLAPGGPLRHWPIDVALDGGADAVEAAIGRLYDELASWFAFSFPVSWRGTATSVGKQREFLLRAARFWRRRGTPRGYVDWLCFAFDVAADDRPFLLEHFKYGRPESADGTHVGPPPGLRATLLVPGTARFEGVASRRHFIEFAERYAPAHIHLRVCWVQPGFTLDPIPGPRPPQPNDPADVPAWQDAVDAWDVDVEAFRLRIRRLLCSLVSFVDHASGVRIFECIDEGSASDRLGVARLPGGGNGQN